MLKVELSDRISTVKPPNKEYLTQDRIECNKPTHAQDTIE